MNNDALVVLLQRLYNAQQTAANVQSEWGKQYWTGVARKLSKKLLENSVRTDVHSGQ